MSVLLITYPPAILLASDKGQRLQLDTRGQSANMHKLLWQQDLLPDTGLVHRGHAVLFSLLTNVLFTWIFIIIVKNDPVMYLMHLLALHRQKMSCFWS